MSSVVCLTQSVVLRWTCTSSSNLPSALYCENETRWLFELWLLQVSPQVQTHKQNCYCVAFHQHRASALTDIVFAFPLLCIFIMIIVWHIQYVNIIIVRGAGPVIMEQEMTCQDPWWPQRESIDLSLTLMFVLGSDCNRGRSATLLTGEEMVIGGVTLKQGMQQCAGNSLWGASFKRDTSHSVEMAYFYFGMLAWHIQFFICVSAENSMALTESKSRAVLLMRKKTPPI